MNVLEILGGGVVLALGLVLAAPATDALAAWLWRRRHPGGRAW